MAVLGRITLSCRRVGEGACAGSEINDSGRLMLRSVGSRSRVQQSIGATFADSAAARTPFRNSSTCRKFCPMSPTPMRSCPCAITCHGKERVYVTQRQRDHTETERARARARQTQRHRDRHGDREKGTDTGADTESIHIGQSAHLPPRRPVGAPVPQGLFSFV